MVVRVRIYAKKAIANIDGIRTRLPPLSREMIQQLAQESLNNMKGIIGLAKYHQRQPPLSATLKRTDLPRKTIITTNARAPDGYPYWEGVDKGFKTRRNFPRVTREFIKKGFLAAVARAKLLAKEKLKELTR